MRAFWKDLLHRRRNDRPSATPAASAPRAGLKIRRDIAPEGRILRFTGPKATRLLMDEVMDHVDQMFGNPD